MEDMGLAIAMEQGRTGNCKRITDLQRDVKMIKKSLLDEPELREDFILRIRDIDQERSIIVDDFGKKYGLK